MSRVPRAHVGQTLLRRMQEFAEACPDRGFLTYLPDSGSEKHSLTVGELHQQALALASVLQQRTGPGDRALILSGPGLYFQVAFLACLYAGVIAVPAFPPASREKRGGSGHNRIESILQDCNPVVVMGTAASLGALQGLADEVWQLPLDASNEGCATWWRDPGIKPETVAFLQYTSGSTSAPKGVVLTHRNIMENQAMISAKFQHDEDTRVASWLPPYHDMGLCCALAQPLFCGGTAVLMSARSFVMHPSRWLKTITEHRATSSGAPNFAYDLCVTRCRESELRELDLSSWRVAFNGAEPINSKTLERFTQRFENFGFRRSAFFPCYGLAEATLFVAGGTVSDEPVVQHFRLDALTRGQVVGALDPTQSVALVGCGSRSIETQVRIVDPQTGQVCPPDVVGEVWVSSPSVGLGYWNRQLESAETFEATLEGEPFKFLRTGDAGFVRHGELFLAGRIKDLVIQHGVNYYPQDIERVVEDAHTALAKNASAAFSVNDDEEEHSREKLVVLAELARGARLSTLAEIEHAVRDAVAANMQLHLHSIKILKAGAIPRTSSGKIQRSTCRAWYRHGNLREVEYAVQTNS